MPHGNRGKRRKRTAEEYEREAEEAEKRLRKYPDRLKSATDSDTFIDFLADIGVYHRAISGGSDFWESVRGKVIEKDTAPIPKQGEKAKSGLFTERQLAEARVNITSWTTKHGKVQVRYRDYETGKYVKRSDIEKGR